MENNNKMNWIHHDDFGIQKTKIKTINFKGGDYIIMREKNQDFYVEWNFMSETYMNYN
jgi:hypothetical protein